MNWSEFAYFWLLIGENLENRLRSVSEYIFYFIRSMSLENVSVYAKGGGSLFLKVMKCVHKSINLKNVNYSILVVTEKIKVSKN